MLDHCVVTCYTNEQASGSSTLTPSKSGMMGTQSHAEKRPHETDFTSAQNIVKSNFAESIISQAKKDLIIANLQLRLHSQTLRF